jgi:hypothetical protein
MKLFIIIFCDQFIRWYKILIFNDMRKNYSILMFLIIAFKKCFKNVMWFIFLKLFS